MIVSAFQGVALLWVTFLLEREKKCDSRYLQAIGPPSPFILFPLHLETDCSSTSNQASYTQVDMRKYRSSPTSCCISKFSPKTFEEINCNQYRDLIFQDGNEMVPQNQRDPSDLSQS